MPKAKKSKRVIEPCPQHPAWSMARYRTFIRSAMRRAWMKWPPKYECLHAARRPYNGPNKKQKWEFQCAHCRGWFMGKNVAVDHIVPWGSLIGLSLEEAWSRLLVGVSGLQVLCSGCHDRKTQSERSAAPTE